MQKKAIKEKRKKKIINTNIDSKQVGFQIPQLKLEAELKQFSSEENPQNTLQIKQDLQSMHKCHPDLIDLLFSIFNPNEVYQYLTSCNAPRPITIRTNTLRILRRDLINLLSKDDIAASPTTDWSKVAILLANVSDDKLQNTSEFLRGCFISQSISSLLPVMALCPHKKDAILDMTAAPGGKTTYIAQLMENTGKIVANDIDADRTEALEGNIQRMGISNTIISTVDACSFKSKTKFDRVLLDAPCSNIGVVSNVQSREDKSMALIKECAEKQKKMIIAGIDSIDSNTSKGGFLVYSVSSVAAEECECVVQYALNHRHVKLVDTGLPIGKEGFVKLGDKKFNKNMGLCKRVYPHTDHMDGYFIAKLKKLNNGEKQCTQLNDESEPITNKKKKKIEKKRLKKRALKESA